MAIRSRRVKLYPPINLETALDIGLDIIEWERIVERLGREPSHFEASIFSALWSDRVSFKNSSALIEASNFNKNELQNLAGSSLRLLKLESDNHDDLAETFEIVLRISQQNRLSNIESSFAGKSSLDSALLELSAAGALPIACLGMARFGSHELLSQQTRFKKIIGGLGSFSNSYGIPMLGGDYYFHPSYNKAPLINTAVLGLVKKRKENEENLEYQSPILYVGAKTGLDHSLGKIPSGKSEKASIPMGDPLLAGRLIRASNEILREAAANEIIVVGAGGLAVASFNLSTRIKKPILLDIDRVPLRKEGLDPLDIILSETADRLLIVTTPEKHRQLNDILYKWDLASTRVGEVNDADGIEFYWNHYQAADIPFHFAVSGATAKTMNVVQFPPMLKRSERTASDLLNNNKKRIDKDEWSLIREVGLSADTKEKETNFPVPSDLEDTWLDMLANPNLSSKQPILANFDQLVGGRSILRPGQDSAALRLSKDSAIAINICSNSLYVSMEPYLGTVQTIAEVMRNLVSNGASPIGISICMNFGSPERYREVCDLSESIRGVGDASRIWNLPVLSEEVSLDNGTDGSPVMPTPVIVGIGKLNNISEACPSFFQEKGDIIFLIGETKNEIGCSEYANYIHKRVNNLVPDIDFDLELKRCNIILELNKLKLLKSCHDLGRGGLGVSLVEACLSRDKPIGANLVFLQENVKSEKNTKLRPDSALFAETSGRFLISLAKENVNAVEDFLAKNEIPIGARGQVGGKTISISGNFEVDLPLSTTYRIWMHRLESYLQSQSKEQLLA